MTVSSLTTKNSYSGNGSTTTFAYGFKIFASAEIKVFIRSAAGTETLKSLTTHYTLTNVGNASGGNVVFESGSVPSNTETVVLIRDTALTQTLDLVENDPFLSGSFENSLDKVTHQMIELQEEVDRSFKVSKTNTITSAEFTDNAAGRASKVLGFSSNGSALEAITGRVNTVTTSNVSTGGNATAAFTASSGALALGIPIGATGAQGNTGNTGASTKWTTGNSFPSSSLANGDLHLFTSAVGSGLTWFDTNGSSGLSSAAKGDIAQYLSSGTKWVKQTNVIGATGNTGSTGSQGNIGNTGASTEWNTGNSFPGSPDNLDLFLFTANVANGLTWKDTDGSTAITAASLGDIAQYLSSGTKWVKQVNIVGSTGAQGSQGNAGNTGNTGSTGSQGATGAVGINSGLSMTWSNSTSDADPGNGKIAFNNATLGSVSILYIDDLDDAGATISGFVQSWDDSVNSTARGIINITKEGTPSTFWVGKVSSAVVNASGYTKVNVTHIVSNGSFSNNDGIGVNFSYSGADGTDGDGSGDMNDVIDDTTPQLGGNLDTNGQDIITTSNATIDLAPHGTGKVVVRGNTNPGTIIFNCESNSHGQTVKSQPHSATVTNTLTLPAGGDAELVSTVATQTLTNKSIVASQLTGTVALARLSDASTSAKGIGSFSSDNFAVSSGAVTIKDAGVDLTAEVTGALPVANAGTGLTSFTAGDLLYATGSTTLVKLAKGSAGQSLVMNSGASAPEWANPSSSVDLNPITKAISILALRDSVTENLAAYSLNNSSIDTFQDSSGIASHSNSARQAGEFVKTTPSYGSMVYHRPHTVGQANGSTLSFSNTSGSGAHDNGGSSYAYADWTTSASGSGWWTLNSAGSTYQNGGRHTIICEIITNNTSGGPNFHYGFNKNDNNNTGYTLNSKWSGGGVSFNSGFRGAGKQTKIVYDPASDENTIVGYKRDSNSASWDGSNVTQTKGSAWDATTLASNGLYHAGQGWIDGGTNWGIRVWASYEPATPSATGNVISNTFTASGTVSEASLVVTYLDNAGTATLNTDIKGYVSANGGTNWTQVTLVAGPLFSTGVKTAMSNKTSISNTGTTMKWKIEWANQSASKETRLDGISLNY